MQSSSLETTANETAQGGYEKKIERIPRVKAGSPKAKQNAGSLKVREEQCYDLFQTYIDVNSGDIVGRKYLGYECYTVGDGGEETPSPGPTHGGGGPSGGDSGESSPAYDIPANIYNAEASISQQQPTAGNADYAATLMIMPNAYHVINVQVEINLQTKELKKVTVTLNGLTWFIKYTQVSDGTLLRYDPATDTYYFKVTTMKEVGGVLSTHREIQGTISPSQGHGTLTIF